jgi:hypothetical protein
VGEVIPNYLKKNKLTRALVIMDQAKLHTTLDLKKAFRKINCETLFIPSRLTGELGFLSRSPRIFPSFLLPTGILQPAEVSWVRPFKSRYRQFWMEWIMQPENYQSTRYGCSTGPPFETVLAWVLSSWDGLDSEIIKKSFIACGINPNEYVTNSYTAVNVFYAQLNRQLSSLLLNKDIPVSFIDSMTEEELKSQQILKIDHNKPEVELYPEHFWPGALFGFTFSHGSKHNSYYSNLSFSATLSK